MPDVRSFRVAELAAIGVLLIEDGNHGEYRPRPEEFTPDGVAYIRAADMTSGVIDFSGAGKINAVARGRIRKGVGCPGDVILSHKGTVGRIAVAPANSPDYVCSPQTTFWRSLDHSALDQGYLRYLMASPKFVAQLEYLKGQTDMAPYVSLTDQRALTLELPPITMQRSIAEVLGALDDKIAANAKVCDLIRGYLDAEYHASVRVNSWLASVADVCLFHNSRRIPLSARERDLRPGAVPYYGATGVFGCVDSALFDEPLVLVGEDGSVITEDGHPVVQYIWGPAWVNNHAHVLTGKTISPELLYIAMKRSDVRHLVTGAVQPKISMGKLKSLGLELPVSADLRRLEDLASAEMALLRSFSAESQSLVEIRDTLLPALMSGKLRVKDAEKQLGEVL